MRNRGVVVGSDPGLLPPLGSGLAPSCYGGAVRDAFGRFAEIDRVLGRALEEDEGPARSRVLRAECGEDDELRREVERLLDGAEERRGPDLSRAAFPSEPVAVIGSRLGHYEVLSKLGEGGMGEVYRARDTKLGRDVALKVLPADFAQDADRLQRFEREARTLASLNHPNIAQVHGFEVDEGRHFLVMELAEGETLAERVRRGPLPVEEAVEIALQIGEALEAAHERSIVHRDLKPANINVSGSAGSYRVKVLDFGLAKALAPAVQGDGDLSQSPTLTEQTAGGVLLGTAAYMSPEQARGQETDARSDIWAFGCVLYEMLAGKPAFGGDTVSDVLARVLRDEPDWSELDAVSPHLRKTIARCCAKNLMGRWHHIHDVLLELRSPELQEAVAATVEARAGEVAERVRLRLVGLGVLAGLLFGLLLGWLGRTAAAPKASSGPVIRAEIEAPLPGDGFQLWSSSVSISDDGRRLAVTGRRDGGPSSLYVKDVAETRWRPLADVEIAGGPVLSPDGRWVLFQNAEGGLWERTPFLGGGSEVVMRRDGNDSPRLPGLQAFRSPSGALLSPWPDEELEGPQNCSDIPHLCRAYAEAVAFSSTVAFISSPNLEGPPSVGHQSLWRSEANRAPTLFIDDAHGARIVGDRLLFLRSGEIWAARLTRNAALAGPAIPTGVRVYQSGPQGPGHYDLSSTGTLFYLDAISPSQLWRLDSNGRRLGRIELAEPLEGGAEVTVAVSPDGKRALVSSGGRMRVISLDSGYDTRRFRGRTGAWIDASSLIHYEGETDSLVVRDSQSRALRRIAVGQPDTWSLDAVDSDRRKVLLTTPAKGEIVGSAQSHGLLLVDLDGDAPNEMWWDALGLDRHSALAPNRSFVAWESIAPSHQIQLSPWGGAPDPSPVTPSGGVVPKFSKDSKKLYYVNPERSKIFSVDLRPGESPPFSPPRYEFDLPEGTIITQHVAYDTLPGGGFLVAVAEKPPRHRLIVNWLQEVDDLLDAEGL